MMDLAEQMIFSLMQSEISTRLMTIAKHPLHFKNSLM